ncbi:MAG: class D sortase [Candidatus Acidiferrales bacterium]
MAHATYDLDLSDGLQGNSPPRKPLRAAILHALRKMIEAVLWTIAVVALGWFAYVQADAYFFQQDQNRRMNALLRRSAESAAVEKESAPSTTRATPDGVMPAPTTSVRILRGDLVARIDIPRLKVSEAVIEGDDTDTLRHAVGHIPGTALPGEPGNIGLAGHRDSFFRKIGELKDGDTLILETARGTFSYHVAKHAIVAPSDTSVLNSTDEPALTLVTCYPFRYIGPAPKRYVITAR